MWFSIKVNYSFINNLLDIQFNSLLTSLFNQSIDSSTNNKGKGARNIDEVDENHSKQSNKKLKTEKLEIRKYNPALRRHTLHREIK